LIVAGIRRETAQVKCDVEASDENKLREPEESKVAKFAVTGSEAGEIGYSSCWSGLQQVVV
jgi:hypothetical protein